MKSNDTETNLILKIYQLKHIKHETNQYIYINDN